MDVLFIVNMLEDIDMEFQRLEHFATENLIKIITTSNSYI